ncbi:MAG: type II toxin-antitoxin system VapC family toxin [Leptolyngbya sp. RL_3_1]|nr:type II toxin-antitoxin system VapC family toxin [Leptolyngbya sp. RL_3_1]
MRVYIDTSVFNRPFDDQTQPRIILETQALRTILQLAENGDLEIVGSSILDYENSRNTNPIRQSWVNRCLQLAKTHQPLQKEIIQRAKMLEQEGVKQVDALHLASAEIAQGDIFLACDDRLLRRYQGPLKAMNPVNFVLELTEVTE